MKDLSQILSLLVLTSLLATARAQVTSQSSHTDDALQVYEELSGKTMLVASHLPRLSEPVISGLPSDRTNALLQIESGLSGNGVQMVEDGPHFVRVFPKGMRDWLTNAPLRGAELSRPEPPGTAPKEMLPAGTINFPGTDLEFFLPIYAELTQRTILRPASLPAPRLRLKSVCSLSQDEASYAMSTVLTLNGIITVNDGEHFVQVVGMDKFRQVEPQAPKPRAGAAVFDPKKIPSEGAVPMEPVILPDDNVVTKVAANIQQGVDRARKAFFDFIHEPDPRNRFADRLLALYAGLTDKEAVQSRNLGGGLMRFTIQTPLTKEELLYAIETTLKLNDLAIIRMDKDKIRLGHLSEAKDNSGNK